MRVHIIHAHPEPSSYNGALTKAATAALLAGGSTVTISNLYQSHFDPVERPEHYVDRAETETFAALNEQRHAWNNGSLPEPVKAEINDLEGADLLIFQFPLWWHSPPAIVKGYGSCLCQRRSL